MTQTLFCFGMGYAAGCIARAWQAQGGRVFGTHRTAQAGDFVFSPQQLLDENGLKALQEADAVLISIPPDEKGDQVFRYYRNVLENAPRLRWLGVFSTTGVYGDHNGAWVDETTPTCAETPRAAQRLAAEREWLSSSLPVHIFRLSGIYGPGRSALERAQENGPLIYKPDHVFNRIHMADIAKAVMASITQPTPHEIYNLSDDLPAPGDEVLRHAYQLLDKTPPPAVDFKDAVLSPMAEEFYAACKRVKADKIKTQLNLKWHYPDYFKGLNALLRQP